MHIEDRRYTVKKRVVLIGIAVALVLAAAIGGTFANFNTELEEPATTTINLNDLDVALAAKPGDIVEANYLIENGVPGQEKKLEGFTVKNVENESGYDLYTKVVIDKQWTGEYKDKLDASMIGLHMDNISLDENNLGKQLNGWWVYYADDEQIILYYTNPICPGEASTDFLSEVVLNPKMTNEYADKTAEITVTVYAVQANAAQKSMLAEWGVLPSFDADGVITDIEE